MNKTLIYILVSGASALAGGVAGYFICKKRLQEKFDNDLVEAINKEIESIRKTRELEKDIPKDEDDSQTHKLERDAVVDLIYEQFPQVSLDSDRVDAIVEKLVECNDRGLSEEAMIEELGDFLDEQGFMDEDPEAEDEGPNFNSIMADYRGRIEVIPLSDYRNLPPTFDFVTYHYFEEDDVLIDDGDLVIDDVDATVGDALLHFDEEEDDGDTVYLINGDYGLAIEVIRLHSSYSAWNGWRL